MPPALVEAAAVVTIAVTAGRVQAAFTREPGITAAQWRQVAGLLTLKEVSGGVAVAVWLVLAWAIGHRPDLRSLRNTQHRGLVVPYRALGWRDTSAHGQDLVCQRRGRGPEIGREDGGRPRLVSASVILQHERRPRCWVTLLSLRSWR